MLKWFLNSISRCVVDEKWYRGRTVTVDNVKKLATIRFVDYGNEVVFNKFTLIEIQILKWFWKSTFI